MSEFERRTKRVFPAVLGLAALLLSAACGSHDPEQVRVHGIERVTIDRLAGDRIRVSVDALAPTGGWSEPKLRKSAETGDDEALSLEFVATPPHEDRVVTQALSPMRAAEIFEITAGQRRVVVLGGSNEIAAAIPER